MRINQLSIVRDPDTRLNVEEIKGRIYYFPVVILQLKDGTFSWRGEGQRLPNGATFVAAAKIIFAGDDDERGGLPLEIDPVAVDLNGSMHFFGTDAEWRALPFEPHYILWGTNEFGRLAVAEFARPTVRVDEQFRCPACGAEYGETESHAGICPDCGNDLL